MSQTSWYILPGVNPVPWKSPTAAVIRTKGGKHVPKFHSPAELRNYKEAVAEAIRQRYPDAPVIEDEVSIRFFFWRQIDVLDRGTGKKRKANYADATNLQKSTEDALQGVLFANDRQVVGTESWVMAQHDAVDPAVVIELTWHPTRPTLPDEVSAELSSQPKLTDDNVHELPEGIF